MSIALGTPVIKSVLTSKKTNNSVVNDISKKNNNTLLNWSIILNVFTILIVVGICIFFYIGFNRNKDVQNLSQLFDRLFSRGTQIPIKNNDTDHTGSFLPNIRSLKYDDVENIFDTWSNLQPSKNPILLDDAHGASLEELQTSRIPYYGDFDLEHPRVPHYKNFEIR